MVHLNAKEKKNDRAKVQVQEIVDENTLGKNEIKRKKSTNALKATMCNFTKSLKDAIEEADYSDRIGDLCEFQCPNCSKIFKSLQTVRKHFKKTMHVLLSRSNTTYDYLSKIVAYKCLVCSVKVICDKRALTSHLHNKHNISLKTYIAQHNLNSKYEVNTTKQSELILQLFNNGIKNKNISTHVENLCEKATLKNATKSSNEAIISDRIGNLCEFQCPYCSKIFTSRQTVRIHFKKTKACCLVKT